MPTCKKCNTSFPNRFSVNGVLKNIGHRKYCLSCSPFGMHNTSKLHLESTRTCVDCGKEFEASRARGTRGRRCASCLTGCRHTQRKLKCISLLGGSCCLCGYSKCIASLKFHHVFPQEKMFNICGNECRAWNVVEKELAKCILVCGNCHDEIHFMHIDVSHLLNRGSV